MEKHFSIMVRFLLPKNYGPFSQCGVWHLHEESTWNGIMPPPKPLKNTCNMAIKQIFKRNTSRYYIRPSLWVHWWLSVTDGRWGWGEEREEERQEWKEGNENKKANTQPLAVWLEAFLITNWSYLRIYDMMWHILSFAF